MHRRAFRQFHTPYLLHHAYGERRWLHPANAENEVTFEPRAGWMARILSFGFKLVVTGAEVSLEPLVRLDNADGRRVLIIPTGMELRAATEKFGCYLVDWHSAAIVGANEFVCPLPDVLLYPGYKMRFDTHIVRGAIEYQENWLQVEEYPQENPSDYDDEHMLVLLAKHLHKEMNSVAY